MTIDKEHVLDEIRRTAKANGGKALGHRRFATETRIGWSDWHGRHWVRWGDAAQEAGVESNPFEDPYDEDYLLKRLLDLTRELGHVPVLGDLRMKARNDSTFSSDRLFRRMGPKRLDSEAVGARAAVRDLRRPCPVARSRRGAVGQDERP